MKLQSIALLCAVLPLSACLNTRPVHDYVHYYLLAPSAGAVEVLHGAPSMGVREVELPGYLLTGKIAIRRHDAEIVYKSFDLWGEALGPSATRTFAGRLAARAGREKVDVFPWTSGVKRDYEVRVQFDHFEGVSDGGVLFSGRYVITPSGRTGEPVVVSFEYPDKWTPGDYASLARALGNDLDRLAAEVLASVGAK